jgi:hypothetical protein
MPNDDAKKPIANINVIILWYRGVVDVMFSPFMPSDYSSDYKS